MGASCSKTQSGMDGGGGGMDGMRGGNTTNTHGSFLMFPKVQQQQQQQQPQNYHHPYPQRQDAFASTGGIPDADVYEFLRRSVALTQGELRHYSPSESTPMSSSQSFVLSSTSLPSAIGYPRKKKRCSKKKKNGSFSNNNNNTGLGGIGGGGQSHLLFKHQQQQQQLLFPLVGTTPSSTSAMVCATESSLTHMNKKHHPNSTPSSMWNNTATHSSGTPPCTTTTTSAGGRKNISTAETAATTRTNATPCSYSSFPTRLLVRRHAVRPSVEEGISGTHIYAVRWWHPQDEEDANAHATRRTLAADRPEQSPPHTSKTNLRGGTTPRNPRPCDSVKFVRALSRTNQQSHFTTSIDDDEDVGVLQTAVSVVDDCTFELLGRSSSTASAAAVASTVSTRLVDGPQQPKQMQSEDRQQAPLLKAVTLEPAAAGDDNYIVAAMTTKAAMPSTTMTHNLQQSAKSGNSLATWNAISATDRATLDCVAKSYRRDDTDDDVMAHHSTTGCPESISVDLLFRPAAMAAPPRRKVADWVTVSAEHCIYVADIGLSVEECNHIVAVTEQQCRGQYAAYTYAKQTLGCREYPALALAVHDVVHTVVSAIVQHQAGELNHQQKKRQEVNDESNIALPTKVFHLSLDDREPHMVKYDVTKKERQKLDMHTDKSEWTFLISVSNGAGVDFTGGGTYFECLDATVHVQRGHALIFPGKLRHCGQRITAGLRFLLVGFLVDKAAEKSNFTTVNTTKDTSFVGSDDIQRYVNNVP